MRLFAISAACTAAGLVALAAASGAQSPRNAAPDAVLASGFSSALADADTAWSSTPPNVWLSSIGTPGAVFGSSLAVGDVVTLRGEDGRPQSVEVTALEQVDGTPLGLPGMSFRLVTGRDTTDAAGVVRFLFAIERPRTPDAIPAPARARTL
jgi:hypothetical protein